MTVKELREALNGYPDDMEVLTKKTEYFGNVGYINSIKEDCILILAPLHFRCLILTYLKKLVDIHIPQVYYLILHLYFHSL